MITKDRQYRSFEIRAAEDGFIVEGYAAVFDTPNVMYEYQGIQYLEEIRSGAFDNADMRDVVLNFNHGGKPVARTKNGTLELRIDPQGLFIRADLSGTEEGRKLFEEVKGGYLDQMSFAFTIQAEEYDKASHLRSITQIKRLYDTAIVDFPAYQETSVSARDFFSVEAERELAEARAALELAKAKYEYEKGEAI
jgi:HK97 family phage prohead protease